MNDITQKIKYLYTEEIVEGIIVRTLTFAETKKEAYKKVGYDPWIKV
jgi:hypothetical protein